jgi:hypothetical protein
MNKSKNYISLKNHKVNVIFYEKEKISLKKNINNSENKKLR